MPDPPGELSPPQVEFCKAYAGDPTLESFGNVLRAAEVTGIHYSTGYEWLKQRPIRERIRQYFRVREEDLLLLREMTFSAAFLAAQRIIALVVRLESLELDTPASLIARERGIDEAEVQLPQEGSMEWGRIHDAVAKHNRNQLGLLKEAVGQASSLLAHAIGHPHTRHEMTIHDDRDDTELAQEVRRLPILAQQRLLDVIRASNDLISKGGRLEPVPSGVHETNGDPSD